MAQWRAVIDLAPTVAAPAAARKLVAAALPGWGLAALVADAEQVVSELVTNAIRHAPGPASYRLELAAHADRLRIYVADDSPARPIVAQRRSHLGHGRGLWIVQALADGWGSEEHDGGKRVWADLLAAPHPDGRVLPFRPHTPRR